MNTDRKPDTQCSTSEELRQLLDRSLSGEWQERMTHHLDDCTCCQAKLEALATEGSNISQVIERLHEAEPMATSAYWPALDLLTAEGGQAVVAQTTVKTVGQAHRRAGFSRPAERSGLPRPVGTIRRDARPGPGRHGNRRRGI